MKQNPILTEKEDHDNPLGMLTNLFDVAMVFAVALMVALVTHYNMSEIFSKDDYTIVKNPGHALLHGVELLHTGAEAYVVEYFALFHSKKLLS